MRRKITFKKIVFLINHKTYSFISRFLKYFFYFFPIKKNKIVFHESRGFGNNPKYIAEEIIKQNLNYEIIWLLDDLRYEVPYPIKKFKTHSIKALYELSTAHVFVDDGKNGLLNLKKKGQFYIQTWHGDFPLKFIEKEAETCLPKWYIKNTKKDSKSTDIFLSGSNLFSNICKESFYKTESSDIIEFGVPRNDIYFRDEDFKNNIRNKYGFSVNDKFLLYAPTFRDDGSINGYLQDFVTIKKTLEKKTNTSWKIIVRMHENALKLAKNIAYDDYIINGSLFPDVQELVIISDILITDYSSIMSDFFIMHKPVLLYINDLDNYITKSRGLRNFFYELPVPMCKDYEELINSIIKYDDNNYITRLDKFMKVHYISFDDGHASERVVELIKKQMNN